MQIVKGLVKGKLGSNSIKLTTNKVHIVHDGKTLCGIDYRQSESLGFPEEGDVSEVNCTRCNKKHSSNIKTVSVGDQP